MKRFHIIVIITLGFFLMPMATFACGKLSGKISYTKEASKNHDNDCCSKDGSHSKKNNDGCCGHKCGHKSCGCVSICNGGITFFNQLDFKNITISVFSKKQKFHSSETSILSGFYTIWLIPKIS
ncbi:MULTISPECIES: hypothetical protein [Flavobacterium]|uniref:Lipoprotein n=2 Tax=Flavobacterium TaxID=237 RepID=A0A9X1H9M6_9FLAO|nr:MULTISPECIES: hypothetical protein [Flavobacterium]NWL03577.1 hypothetical protein [Flavobacterium collinsii]MBW1658645.1 hypothetical protein [Flavobacterium quisquiliarum]MBZ4035268.1 hypothetical protein [Flavobacterium potami]WET02503.1 hypothetical protein P0R33_22370 [Flavobacterium sp. YJ01]WJS93476.1 hypothetical protein NYQ10_15400 [Flavobacterium johnsoniae]